MISLISFVFCVAAVYFAETRNFAFVETARFLFILPVLLCAYFWGREGGILSSLLAVTLYVPLFISLLDSDGFSPRAVEVLVTLFVLVFIGVLSGALFGRDREVEEVLSFFAGMCENEGENVEEVFKRMTGKLQSCSFIGGEGPSVPVQTDSGEIRLAFRRARLQEKDRDFSRLLSGRLNALLHKLQLVEDAVEAKQNFSEILDALPVGVLQMSREKRIIYSNAILREHLSYYIENDDEFARLYKDVLAEMIHESTSSDGLIYREFMLEKAREEQSVLNEALYSVTCHALSEDKTALFVIEDLSRRHALLTLQDKDALREDFFSGVSHDIKNPANALWGYLKELNSRAEQQTEGASVSDETILAGMNDCLAKIKRLSGDLLDVARLEAGKQFELNRERVCVTELAQEVVETLKPFCSLHEFEVFSKNKENVFLKSDAQRLRQIFFNLVENAVKYSPRGGKVSVAVEQDDAHVLVSVCDEGLGIPQNEVKNVFNKFYRVKTDETRRIHGTGFGLYLVKSLVEMQGGTIGAQSILEKGSVFTVVFPQN